MRMICLNFLFFFSSRRRHTRSKRDWSSDVCSSDLAAYINFITSPQAMDVSVETGNLPVLASSKQPSVALMREVATAWGELSKDRKSTRLNSSHVSISYAVFCLKKKRNMHLRDLVIE